MGSTVTNLPVRAVLVKNATASGGDAPVAGFLTVLPAVLPAGAGGIVVAIVTLGLTTMRGRIAQLPILATFI